MKDLKNENFANYEISKETEKKMMDNDRFGDPMLRMIEKDKKENTEYLNIISNYFSQVFFVAFQCFLILFFQVHFLSLSYNIS